MTTAVERREAEAAQRAFALETTIRGVWADTHEGMWRVAEALYEFHELEGWRFLGADTLNEWLAQPELAMSRRQFFLLSKMWRDLAVVRKVPTSALKQLPPSKVAEVLPAINRGADLKKALADVKSMGARDLRREYRGEREQEPPKDDNGATPESHDGSGGESAQVQCEACGSWYVPGGGDDS